MADQDRLAGRLSQDRATEFNVTDNDVRPPATSALRDRFLTVRWNNLLTGVLGFPALIYAAAVLSTSALSGRSAFIGMALIGAVY